MMCRQSEIICLWLALAWIMCTMHTYTMSAQMADDKREEDEEKKRRMNDIIKKQTHTHIQK